MRFSGKENDMLEIIVTSSLLIIAMAVLRRLWRRKISRRLQYALWLLVALRLLAPVTMFENPFNIMNILRNAAEGEELPEYGSLGTGKVVYNGNWSKISLTDFEEGVKGQAAKGGTAILGGTAAPESTAVPESRTQGNGINGETGVTKRAEAVGSTFGLKAQERILEGGSGLERFFTKGLWRHVWYGGMVLLSLWMIGCNLLFRRRLSKNRTFLGREGGLMVYLAEEIGTPCLLGFLHPAIYLTHESAYNPRHREHAVLHELTHYRHGDHFWALIRSLCLVIYWFDPLVWLAVRLSAKDCELACDEGMVSRLGEERSREYGCTLIEMAASGGKGMGLFRCAAGFSVRKRELRDRITQIAAGEKRTGLLVALLVAASGILLAACTFGGTKKEEEMGRYVETAVELPENVRACHNLAQDGDVIRLVAAEGRDIQSADGTDDFAVVEMADMPRGAVELSVRYPAKVVGSISGARLFNFFDEDGYPTITWLITDAGKHIRLEAVEGQWTDFFYSGGYFWVSAQTDAGEQYYRLDPATGEMRFLMECSDFIYYMAADEEILYLVSSQGVRLFDLEKGILCTEQDQVLSDFAVGKFITAEVIPIMLYPWRDGVYILTHQGLYWHKLYDETVELVIDGGYCSMGGTGKTFSGMALRETEGEPEFFVLYSEGELMHYTYDASLPEVPDALRVYSVYEDCQVSKAVNSFRIQNPDIPIVYEVGMNSVYGATLDDVLKNLATEIAAGNGPDILLMDDIPFDSYAEKGVLADLSFLRKGMTCDTYFVNVIDAFARDEKLYAIPMTFAVPVLAGQEELLEGVQSLETLADLADLLEEDRKSGEEDYVFCTVDAEDTLRLLAQSSQGAWMQEGALNREAVEEFLTQAKRIYDIQFSVAEEPNPEEGIWDFLLTMKHANLDPSLWIGDYKCYPLARRFDSDGLYWMMHKTKWQFENETACYAGFVSGGERDFMLFQGGRKIYGDIYTMMPGQQYGTCLASSLLAVNAGTDRMEESIQFLEYAVSCEFLSKSDLNGTPISREAYLAKQRIKEEIGVHEEDEYGSVLIRNKNLEIVEYLFDWPDAEEYEGLIELLDSVTGVNVCDTVVYETVVEYGKAVLTGETGISEAVEAIEKRVKIYLAE